MYDLNQFEKKGLREWSGCCDEIYEFFAVQQIGDVISPILALKVICNERGYSL